MHTLKCSPCVYTPECWNTETAFCFVEISPFAAELKMFESV